MPIALDIYIANPADEDNDLYLERHWNVVPEAGETIAFKHVDETTGDETVRFGIVAQRIFLTDDEGHLRVQLHCDPGEEHEENRPEDDPGTL